MRLRLPLTPCIWAALAACATDPSTLGASSGRADADGGLDAGADESDASSVDVDTNVDDGSIAFPCGELKIPATVEVLAQPGNVLIVFDQSKSMTTIFGGKPLWQAASDAVRDALAPHRAALTVGAIFFPTAPDPTTITCAESLVAPIGTPPQIPFQAGESFLAAWAKRFSAANLVLGTPTPRAMMVADSALEQSKLSGETVVILVTDGASTCPLTSPTSEQVAAGWTPRGILTYVIGLPGSQSAEKELNAIAMAGGTDEYFTPADSAALTDELGRIFGAITRPTLTSCDIRFDEGDIQGILEQANLIVTERETGKRFRVASGPDGWQLAADQRGAKLLGEVCLDAKAGRFSDVSFEFGCFEVPLL